MPSSLNQQLRQLRNAIVNKPPYRSGTIPVTKNELVVYYSKGEDENAHRINLGTASADSLEHLAQTCDAATFGRDDEDVLDESYRKARKLDIPNFSVGLGVETNGLMDVVRGQLLEGREAQQSIYAELYKLNVYGEGSFFKAHVDTPRGGTMFGSLVVIYPTPHEGGSLIFRDGTNEWSFDSAQAIKTSSVTNPCVAYAIFFSDVEHEVTRVMSGHRVTVTYNLYFMEPAALRTASLTLPAASPDTHGGMLAFNSVLQEFLQDENFLPEGGYLGFGLRRVYPLEKSSTPLKVRPVSWLSATHETLRLSLSRLIQCLKGSDADVLQACTALGLHASLWMLFTEKDGDRATSVLLPSAPAIEGSRFDSFHVMEELATMRRAKRIPPVDLSKDDEDDDVPAGRVTRASEKAQKKRESEFDMKIHWVTKPTDFNMVKNSVVAHGNEPCIGYAYGYISMIVQVGKPGERSTVNEPTVS
ncbi:hypothetical protein EIP86_009532 [Pleurotus ostreatoroseus]|nr:hypothetical protein EIP86_009532 [Pleurotus ostreatoroseus]